MGKALEKVPETLAELKAALPELTALAIEEGRAQAAAATVDAVKAEQERIVGLIGASTDDETGAKFRAAILSGMTPEALKTLGVSLIPAGDAVLKAEVDALKAKNLELLKATGSENPGADAGHKPESGKDYMSLVRDYKAAHACTTTKAMMAINAEHPEVHERYIDTANAGRRV